MRRMYGIDIHFRNPLVVSSETGSCTITRCNAPSGGEAKVDREGTNEDTTKLFESSLNNTIHFLFFLVVIVPRGTFTDYTHQSVCQ